MKGALLCHTNDGRQESQGEENKRTGRGAGGCKSEKFGTCMINPRAFESAREARAMRS